MTVAVEEPGTMAKPRGRVTPRIAPPVPARSDLKAYQEIATEIGIELLPWQEVAARYIEAKAPDPDRHLYREVAIIVSRQNGKSTILVPLFVKRLLAGQRVMHTAQDRALPREIFGIVAELMWENHPELFPMRNGRRTKPRYANGSEEVRLTNGAIYSIVAPSRGGARGPSRDLVVIDEAREMEDWDFIAAAKPTLTASKDPQIIYLSNAGHDGSVVLNALKKRATEDESLAYLEWSASPERSVDDLVGWSESNPAMGYEVGEMGSIYDTLVAELRAARIDNTLRNFETEHLCRSVITEQPHAVPLAAWDQCRGTVEGAEHSSIAFNMDPSGHRASVLRAWTQTDGRIAVEELIEAKGETDLIDTERLGRDIAKLVRTHRAKGVAFASWTDRDIARYIPAAKPVDEKDFAAASEMFARYVATGRIVWENAMHVGNDLPAVIRRTHHSGAWQAVPATPEHSITAALAAIRAVWLESAPRPAPSRVF